MYRIIYNPISKNGKSRPILEKVCARLAERNADYILYETSRAGEAEELASNAEADDVLVVVGGDGTIHEALNGMRFPESTEIVLVPAGTGNDFCTGVGIPFDVDKLMDLVFCGQPKKTDYLQIGDRRCMNVAGLGMDVEVLKRCLQGKWKGKLKYFISLLSCLFTFKGYDMKISVNGETYEDKALLVAACNSDRFGGGVRICPNANVEDGKLEMVFVRKLNFFGIVRAFAALVSGKILSFPDTVHCYCDCVEILPDQPRTIQLDGELYEDNAVFKAHIATGLKIYR